MVPIEYSGMKEITAAVKAEEDIVLHSWESARVCSFTIG